MTAYCSNCGHKMVLKSNKPYYSSKTGKPLWFTETWRCSNSPFKCLNRLMGIGYKEAKEVK